MREIDAKALAATVAKTDLPPSVVKWVIRAYLDDLERQELANNHWVGKLAQMKIGQTIFWRPSARYLQTADKDRARRLMGDQEAAWSSFYRQGMLVVKRVK